MKYLLALFLFISMPAFAADALPVLKTTKDCPLAAPFVQIMGRPRFDDLAANKGMDHILFGYVVRRIEVNVKEVETPFDLEVTWSPVEAKWGHKQATLHVTASGPTCFLTDSIFPANVPASRLLVKSTADVKNIRVTFSNIPWDKEGDCPASKLCPQLIRQIDGCSKDKEASICDDFVDTMKELVPAHECRRTNDTDPVPAMWMCDELTRRNQENGDIHEKAFHLLKGLTSKKAVDFYKSREFQSTLDGAFAEEYHDN